MRGNNILEFQEIEDRRGNEVPDLYDGVEDDVKYAFGGAPTEGEKVENVEVSQDEMLRELDEKQSRRLGVLAFGRVRSEDLIAKFREKKYGYGEAAA